MRASNLFLALAATTLLATGCAQQKNQATKALTSIETEVNGMKAEAEKYAPVAYQGVESTLTMLKDSLAKEDYKEVLAGTPKLQEAVDSLAVAIVSGKEQFTAATAEWNTLNEEVPKMVSAIQSRVDTLSKSKKLPKEVSKDAFEAGKSGLDSMKSTWNEATAAFNDGKPQEARDKAQEVKAKGVEVMQQLGVKQT
jgi:chromosome segregation ATPase